jgi:hypothetical protein
MRSCYEQDMQFDQAGELVTRVRWYFCPDGAEPLPWPTLFASSNWNWNSRIRLGPGELWHSVRTYSKGQLPGPYTGKGGVCGPAEWWQNGVPSDAPPLIYDSDNVPPCCQKAPPPCQPWRSPHGTLAVHTPNYRDGWSLFADSPDLIQWNQFDPLAEVIVTPAGTCSGGSGLSVFAALEDYDFGPGDMVFQSYDASTFTGTWIPGPGAEAPAGFKVILTIPPP